MACTISPAWRWRTFAGRDGPQMAAADHLEITVRGRGGHAAQPHNTVDPIVVASHVVGALQSIASRAADPIESVVVSITQFHAGSADNVIADVAELRGTVRTFKPALRDMAERRIKEIATGVATAFGATADVLYRRGYPPTVNHAAQFRKAIDVATEIAGKANVSDEAPPLMGAEDFSFMLEKKPGAYIFIGAGPGDNGRSLHQVNYDFNDELLPIGAQLLGKAGRDAAAEALTAIRQSGVFAI